MRLAEATAVGVTRTSLHSVEGATELAVTNRFTVHGNPEPWRRAARNGRFTYKAPKDQAGVPITVHVRCAGGTTAAATVTLHDSGDISIGDVTFDQGWPVGADCVVSQEIVQGVDIAQKTLTWLSSTNLQANFLNT